MDPTTARAGKWTADEDSKLEDAVQTHGDKDWVAICALVPGRTRTQCNHRWHNPLHPSIGRVIRRKGKWSAVEDSQLKHAVQTHADMDWVAISALVPGRTKIQCWNRWKYIYPNRSTIRGIEHSTLKKAPVLGQDAHPPPLTYVEFMD
jgi:hypothetical protein